jgi:uncharacterized protein
MIIHEMTQQEVKEFLGRASIGRLACVANNRPYIVPLSFAYNSVYLYSLTTVGQKIDWMRKNPKVCVQFDEIQSTNMWQSVIVQGDFEELTSDPQHIEARNAAHQLLNRSAEWWEPAFVRTVIRGKERALEPVYFRIFISEMNGHKATKSH